MGSTLHFGGAGVDRSGFVVESVLEGLGESMGGLPKIWVLCATVRQVYHLRQRLAEAGGGSAAYFNIEFFNFYRVNERLLNLAGRPARRITVHTRMALLRGLVVGLREEGGLGHFHRIADKPGFIEAVGGLINELKQNGVDEERFAGGAVSAKDRDIAAIYGRYQGALKERNWVDGEGEGWLALATLRGREEIVGDVDRVLVDGFDHFTPVQAGLLARLSRGVGRVDITLRGQAEGAELFSRRVELARERLEGAHREEGAELRIVSLRGRDSGQDADIAGLGRGLFLRRGERVGGDAIRMLERPSEGEEARAVLRSVKGRLLGGARADDILIALRDWERYAGHFRRVGEEYGLPLALHQEESLGPVPIIAVIVDLLEMGPQIRRVDALDVLRSPYLDTGLGEGDVDLLDRISREKVFLRGSKEEWLGMLGGVDGAGDLAERLGRFLDGTGPPETGDLPGYVGWLEGMLGIGDGAGLFSLKVAERVEGAGDGIAGRDRAALGSLRRILRDMLATDSLLGGREAAWGSFWDDVKRAIRGARAGEGGGSRGGRVLVTTAAEARGLPHEHVYILGLAEGLFPAEASEEPIYLDSDRERLRSRGITLEAQAEREDDRGLFLELIGLPRSSLTLSRPTAQDGKLLPESYLWRAVLRVYPRMAIDGAAVGELWSVGESASMAELMLSMAHHMGGLEAGRAQAWVESRSELGGRWGRIKRGRDVELGRLSYAGHDGYSGRLMGRELVEVAGRELGEGRMWSATQLKDYGLCGFRFFAKRLLRLEAVEEVGIGYDVLQLGSLNHRILEETYRRIQARGLVVCEENMEEALAIFEEVAGAILRRGPRAFGFQARATWDAESGMLLRRLRALIKRDFSGDSPLDCLGAGRRIYGVESRFDDARIALPELGEELRLRGTIDRIDEVDGELVVVDYKTGTTKINRSEMEEGRDFQMMAYVLALESALEAESNSREVKRGMFWHLRNLETSGAYDSDEEEDEQALETARGHVAENLVAGRAGQFPVKPNKVDGGKCARYCEYAGLCRVSVTNRYKGGR